MLVRSLNFFPTLFRNEDAAEPVQKWFAQLLIVETAQRQNGFIRSNIEANRPNRLPSRRGVGGLPSIGVVLRNLFDDGESLTILDCEMVAC